jgi:hypothetical protein
MSRSGRMHRLNPAVGHFLSARKEWEWPASPQAAPVQTPLPSPIDPCAASLAASLSLPLKLRQLDPRGCVATAQVEAPWRRVDLSEQDSGSGDDFARPRTPVRGRRGHTKPRPWDLARCWHGRAYGAGPRGTAPAAQARGRSARQTPASRCVGGRIRPHPTGQDVSN